MRVYGPRFFVSGLFSLFVSVSIVHFFTLFLLLFYFLFALCSRGFARIIFAVRTGTHSTRARVLVLRFILLNYGHGRGFPCLSGRCSRAAPNVFDPPPPSFPFPNFISAPKKSSKLSSRKTPQSPLGQREKLLGRGVPGGQPHPLSRFCGLSAFPLSPPPHP